MRALGQDRCAKPPPESRGWFLSNGVMLVSLTDLCQTLRPRGTEARALASPTGMVKYETGVPSLRDKRKKSRQHLHPYNGLFLIQMKHSASINQSRAIATAVSYKPPSPLKPRSQGEVGTGDMFSVATCLHTPHLQHATLPKGRGAVRMPVLHSLKLRSIWS